MLRKIIPFPVCVLALFLSDPLYANDSRDSVLYQLGISANDVPGKVTATIDPQEGLKFIFHPDESEEIIKKFKDTGIKVYNKNYKFDLGGGIFYDNSKNIEYFALKDEKGKVQSIYMTEPNVGNPGILLEQARPGWSVGKLDPKMQNVSGPSNLPITIPDDKIIDALRDAIERQAVALGCSSERRPIEIEISASVSATAGVVFASGTGEISYKVKWETKTLCG